MRKGLVILIAGLTLLGCSRGRQRSELIVQLSAEPVSLDPALAEDGLSLKILSNTMDGLVGYDGSGKLETRIASGWNFSPDGLRLMFELRPEARWSDGVVVTAQHFVVGIRRVLSPGSTSKLGELLKPIRGAREFQAGRTSELGIRAEGPHRLVIELERKAPYFLQALTLPVALPEREDMEDAPSTGPYRLLSRKRDQWLRLERVPGHLGPWAQGAPEAVVFQIVHDESTALNLFEQGKIDILTRVPALEITRLREKGVLRTDPFFATYYIGFNTEKPPFNDKDARRALSGAIRRSEITGLLQAGDEPARSWISKGLEGYLAYEDPLPVFRHSLEQVRARSSKFSIPVTYDAGARNQLIMEKIQADVKSALGWSLELMPADWKAHVASVGVGFAPLYRFGWLAPIADPITHLEAFTSGNPNNHSRWSNVDYDRLVSEISALEPGEVRIQKIREAQEILVDREAAIVPVFHYSQAHAISQRVTGFRVNPFGVIRFSELVMVGGRTSNL